ncbi:MAG TPA: zinc ribbon domain-containing protein [Actinomycetota bacterium]|jgi:hypothetical protein|nr:zinc ribbon domain-containing protein [Actinomycetota bacterium]
MRAWCPRCDAVRPGETTCPACGTPLATLDDTVPGDRPTDLPPPPSAEEGAAPPARPPRLRVALAAAILVVGGLAFVAGRSLARPAAPAAAQAPATSTTAPEPGADRRQLGWSARGGGLTITAVDAVRVATDQRETVAAVTFRVQGVPGGQRVLALRGLRLLDSGGGVYASVDQRQVGREGGAPVEPVEGRPGVYRLVTGPAPRLSSLARIELAGVVAVRPRDQTITLDTPGPWPPGPKLKTVDPGPDDAIQVDLGSVQVQDDALRLQVTSAFVRAGQALVVIDASSGFRGVPGELLPVGAELRAGGRVLCSRTSLLGEDNGQQGVQGIVLNCPTGQVPRLTVALGVGARMLPLRVTLTP